MRILFTFIGGSGHFRPLIPIALAAQAAGHTIAVAGAAGRIPEVEAAGFTGFATSEPRKRPQNEQRVLQAPDPEAELRNLREGFARVGGRRQAAAVLEIARNWKPDLVVRDEVDFGSALAAEVLGIPCATVIVLGAGGFLRKEVVAEPLHELRAEYGLPADPELAMLDRGPVLSPFPPSFRDPRFPLPGHAFGYRQATIESVGAEGRTPTVYFTLGTEDNTSDLFTRVLAGLGSLPTNVVVTVGNGIDPGELGPLPAHIRVERFIPQEELLPKVDLVISHGGSGSLLGALAHGLPSILLPVGADQPYNARRCVELGTARVLDPMTATPDEVLAAVTGVLDDPSYHRAARRLRDELEALPGPEAVVALLEGLLTAPA